jgi:hypothetical protein
MTDGNVEWLNECLPGSKGREGTRAKDQVCRNAIVPFGYGFLQARLQKSRVDHDTSAVAQARLKRISVRPAGGHLILIQVIERPPDLERERVGKTPEILGDIRTRRLANRIDPYNSIVHLPSYSMGAHSGLLKPPGKVACLSLFSKT